MRRRNNVLAIARAHPVFRNDTPDSVQLWLRIDWEFNLTLVVFVVVRQHGFIKSRLSFLGLLDSKAVSLFQLLLVLGLGLLSGLLLPRSLVRLASIFAFAKVGLFSVILPSTTPSREKYELSLTTISHRWIFPTSVSL